MVKGGESTVLFPNFEYEKLLRSQKFVVVVVFVVDFAEDWEFFSAEFTFQRDIFAKRKWKKEKDFRLRNFWLGSLQSRRPIFHYLLCRWRPSTKAQIISFSHVTRCPPQKWVSAPLHGVHGYRFAFFFCSFQTTVVVRRAVSQRTHFMSFHQSSSWARCTFLFCAEDRL